MFFTGHRVWLCEQEIACAPLLLPVAPEGCADLFQKDQSNPDPFLHAWSCYSSSGMVREFKYCLFIGPSLEGSAFRAWG